MGQRDLLCSYDVSAEQAVFDTRRPVLSKAYNTFPQDEKMDPTLLQELHIFADWIHDFIGPDDDPLEPVSDIFYPIMEHAIDSVVLLTTISSSSSSSSAAASASASAASAAAAAAAAEEEEEAKPEDYSCIPDPFSVLAFLAVSIYWRDMITDILPPGKEGILLVVENPCNPTFTYEIVSACMQFPPIYGNALHVSTLGILRSSLLLTIFFLLFLCVSISCPSVRLGRLAQTLFI